MSTVGDPETRERADLPVQARLVGIVRELTEEVHPRRKGQVDVRLDKRLREDLDDLYIMSLPPADLDLADEAFLPNPIVLDTTAPAICIATTRARPARPITSPSQAAAAAASTCGLAASACRHQPA